jgi:hypothetical protein
MMTKTVTVTYISPTLVKVEPDVVPVDAGDTIEFVQAPGMPGKLRLTFLEREFFNTTNNSKFAERGEFHLVDGQVRVVTTLPHRTTYKCQLLDENDDKRIIAESDFKGGGAVDPIKPK